MQVIKLKGFFIISSYEISKSQQVSTWHLNDKQFELKIGAF